MGEFTFAYSSCILFCVCFTFLPTNDLFTPLGLPMQPHTPPPNPLSQSPPLRKAVARTLVRACESYTKLCSERARPCMRKKRNNVIARASTGLCAPKPSARAHMERTHARTRASARMNSWAAQRQSADCFSCGLLLLLQPALCMLAAC